MSQTLLNDLPQEIADTIRSALPELVTCEVQAGPFNVDDLKSKSIRTPAVIVSLLSLKPRAVSHADTWAHDLELGAYVVTSDRKGLPRDIAAANLCQALVNLIQETALGVFAVRGS